MNDIFNPDFWRTRIREAYQNLPTAVFSTSANQWTKIQQASRAILWRHLSPGDSLLDAACAYGLLVHVLPPDIAYLGVDLSPDFITLARQYHPHLSFQVADLRHMPEFSDHQFDFAFARSLRGMVIRDASQADWDAMQTELLRVARRLILLEYDLAHYDILTPTTTTKHLLDHHDLKL